MEYIARHGYDVYLLDVRGYGMSTRPPQMDKPPLDSPPFAGIDEALRDDTAVVEFVRKRLLIKAEWDQDTPAYMAQNLFPKLLNAPYKLQALRRAG
jgi:pimeloyl-ACP methyl ester carboxylesterase